MKYVSIAASLRGDLHCLVLRNHLFDSKREPIASQKNRWLTRCLTKRTLQNKILQTISRVRSREKVFRYLPKIFGCSLHMHISTRMVPQRTTQHSYEPKLNTTSFDVWNPIYGRAHTLIKHAKNNNYRTLLKIDILFLSLFDSPLGCARYVLLVLVGT